MTIPQIISWVGWHLFGLSAAFFRALHTVNMLVPGADFILPTTMFGIWGYVVGVPLFVIGGVLGVLGFFSERVEEWWLNRSRDD